MRSVWAIEEQALTLFISKDSQESRFLSTFANTNRQINRNLAYKNMSIFDYYNSGYKNILLFFKVYGQLQLIDSHPFNDAEIDSIRSNCVMDNNAPKVACLRTKGGGYIYIQTLNKQEELIRGNKIDLKNVILVRLCHINIGFDSKFKERLCIYIPINNKDIGIGSKIQLDGNAWEVVGKRPFNKDEIDYVQSAYVSTYEPDKYVLFFMKNGGQTKIPLSPFGVDFPIGSSVDLAKANLVTYYREGDGKYLRVEVKSKTYENTNKTEDNRIKKRAAKEQEEDEKTKNTKTVWNYKIIINLLGEIIWVILVVLFLSFVIYSFFK